MTLLTATLLMALTTFTFAAAPSFRVPRLEHIVIDGNPQDWTQGFAVDILVPAEGAIPARHDFSADVRLGWNDTGLLVFVSVTGRDWTEAEKLDELWKADSVELHLATGIGSRDQCQWLIAPASDPVRSHLHDHRTDGNLRQLPAEIQVARRRTATGYDLEALLPWTALAIEPVVGREVAFQIMVNKSQHHLLWFPMPGAAFDARKMHRLELATTTSPPIIARAVGRLDRRADRTEFHVFAPATSTGQTARIAGATAPVQTDATGYARAQLVVPGAGLDSATLEINGAVVEVVPLTLPDQITPAREWSLDTRVRVEPSPLSFVLTLPAATIPYQISRREPGQLWQALTTNAPAGEFRDTGVQPGRVYEYAIVRQSEPPARDYFYTGHEVPLRDRRGTVLLLVEQSQAAPLATEIRRLMLDLVGDGWQVVRKDVPATESPAAVKQLITAAVDTVFLLGHIPVPYSGHFAPDGHDDQVGAWPADVYYGTGDAAWTDTVVSNTVAGRHGNVPGDGTFDQNQIPGPVHLAVGRVDLSALPAFATNETALLRQYLDRNHAYRHGTLPTINQALIQDHFVHHTERFAYSGWQNFANLVGSENVRVAEWPNIPPTMNLWFYGCGQGGREHMAGFGNTGALVATPLNAVFTMLFGSYFGDWDVPNNLLRAALATAGGALTCGWAGRPHWYLHPMAFGETIGACLRLTQNNNGRDYQPTGGFARGVHIALMGDPTLRLHRVAPPSALRLEAGQLRWQASPQMVRGYHVYRAASEFGPYERLTPTPIPACEFHDAAGSPEHHYQVRAVAWQSTPTGYYENASQGVFVSPAK